MKKRPISLRDRERATKGDGLPIKLPQRKLKNRESIVENATPLS